MVSLWLVEFQQFELLEKYILIFILTFTVIGNTLILVATCKGKYPQHPINQFIACLALSDVLVGMFVVPIRLYRLLNMQNGGITSIYLCYFYMWIDPLAETASVYTLTFISFDRYLKISKPLRYKSRMATSTSQKLILVIWFISVVHGTLSMSSYAENPGTLITEFGCVAYDKIFYMFAADSIFFVPITIIFFMNGLTFFIAHERQKILANGALCNDGKCRRRAAFLQDLKVMRIFVVVVAVFIFCRGPFFIWLMLNYYYHDFFVLYTKNQMVAIEKGILLLSLFNSLCNPIIYVCFHQKYWAKFRCLFRRNYMSAKLKKATTTPPRTIEVRKLR